MISKLPDDIDSYVVSHLSLKEAVRTSILSRKWRHLWRTSVKNLDFDGDCTELKQLDDTAFVKYVNHVLAQFHPCGATIESFQVRRRLRPPQKYKDEIENWIKFAAYKKVQMLDIDLCCSCLQMERQNHVKLYMFPYSLFTNQNKGSSALTHLSLSGYTFDLSPKFSHLNFLVSLTLKCVPMTQEKLFNILSNCLSLQWLSLIVCYCSRHLKFSSGLCSSLKLKHLNIWNCDNLKTVDIRNFENLTSFEISGHMLVEVLCNQKAPVTRVYYDQYHFRNPYYYSNQVIQPAKDFQLLARDFPLLKTLLYVSPCLRVNSNV